MTVAVPLLRGARFNEDSTRFITPTRTGIACYRRASTALGQWRGFLVGVTRDETLAQRFLYGEEVAIPQR